MPVMMRKMMMVVTLKSKKTKYWQRTPSNTKAYASIVARWATCPRIVG